MIGAGITGAGGAGMSGQLLPLILLAPVLVAAAVSDLRRMRIPNWLGLVAVALFVALLAAGAVTDPIMRVIAAAAVLVIGFGIFALGAIGGGDVKFLAAMMLFVPPSTLTLFAYVFSAAMIVGMVSVLAARRSGLLATSSWRAFDGETGFPMGLSISLAGLAHPLIVHWLA